jgi:hypothetical protein
VCSEHLLAVGGFLHRPQHPFKVTADTPSARLDGCGQSHPAEYGKPRRYVAVLSVPDCLAGGRPIEREPGGISDLTSVSTDDPVE